MTQLDAREHVPGTELADNVVHLAPAVKGFGVVEQAVNNRSTGHLGELTGLLQQLTDEVSALAARGELDLRLAAETAGSIERLFEALVRAAPSSV